MPERFMFHVWTKLKKKTLIVFLHQIKNQRLSTESNFILLKGKKILLYILMAVTVTFILR